MTVNPHLFVSNPFLCGAHDFAVHLHFVFGKLDANLVDKVLHEIHLD